MSYITKQIEEQCDVLETRLSFVKTKSHLGSSTTRILFGKTKMNTHIYKT